MSKGIRFTEEFKKDAVAQIVDCGYTVREVADRLGIITKSLYTWKAQFSRTTKVLSDEAALAAELQRTRKELARVTEETDFFAKAGIFLYRILVRPRHQIIMLVLLNPLVQRRKTTPKSDETCGRVTPLVVAMRTASRRNSSVYLVAISCFLHSKHCSKETGTELGQDHFANDMFRFPWIRCIVDWNTGKSVVHFLFLRKSVSCAQRTLVRAVAKVCCPLFNSRVRHFSSLARFTIDDPALKISPVFSTLLV